MPLAFLFAVVLGDVVRIGFFADDFLFLDAARCRPPSEVLLGHHGIYPWYRPLARELYFYLALFAEPWGRALTVALSLATAAVATGALLSIGRSLSSWRIGLVAALLFLAHEFTKFLTAWGSGYQDLLSITLVLLAVSLELSGRTRLALVAGFLSPFAKETGALVFVLLPAARRISGRGVDRRFLLGVCGAALTALAIHLAVRATWPNRMSSLDITFQPLRALADVLEMVRGFVPPPAGKDPIGLGLALLAGAIAWRLVGPGAGAIAGDSSRAGQRRVVRLAVLGAVLGLSPLLVGNWLGLSPTKAYYAFPAVPWIALLVAGFASALPLRMLQAGAALAVGWSAFALHYRAPDLDRPAGWIASPPGWHEAARLSAVAARFRTDLAAIRAEIPRGSVVLYSRIPSGAFLVQGDDGSTTRELLEDRSLRAGYLGDHSLQESVGRRVLVEFDPRDLHLRRVFPGDPELLAQAAQQLLLRDVPKAQGFASYAEPVTAEQRALRAHLLGLAWMQQEGPQGLRRAISRKLWPDSNSVDVRRVAGLLEGGDTAATLAYARILGRPLTDSSYTAAVETLLVHGRPLQAAVYLRALFVLRAGNGVEHVVLAQLLDEFAMAHAAEAEYAHAIAADDPRRAADDARRLLQERHRRARGAGDASAR